MKNALVRGFLTLGLAASLAASLVASAAAQSGFSTAGWPRKYAPEVGEPHADFVLPEIRTREPISLSQFRGRKVLLIQFASW